MRSFVAKFFVSVISLALLSPLRASAENDNELMIGLFTFGYSDYAGGVSLAKFSLGSLISSHWQWESMGMVKLYSRHGTQGGGLASGAVFNLSDDTGRSTFFAAGAGYSSEFPFGRIDHQLPSAYGYVRVGHRISLDRSGDFTYRPSVTWSNDGSQSGWEIGLLDLSLLF